MNGYPLDKPGPCEVCGKPATHLCPAASSLVCGAKLCNNCTHNYNDPDRFYSHKRKTD